MSDARDAAMDQASVRGVFDYIAKNDGWADSFRVIDDDGAPFVLTDLQRFHGEDVVITVRRWRASSIDSRKTPNE